MNQTPIKEIKPISDKKIRQDNDGNKNKTNSNSKMGVTVASGKSPKSIQNSRVFQNLPEKRS